MIYSHSVPNYRWTSGVLLVFVEVGQTGRPNSALFLIIHTEIYFYVVDISFRCGIDMFLCLQNCS